MMYGWVPTYILKQSDSPSPLLRAQPSLPGEGLSRAMAVAGSPRKSRPKTVRFCR